MLVNWFTVIAQIVNFLILVVLLKYLLYDRIIKGMENRENEIRSRFDEAEKRQEEAEKQKEENEKDREKLSREKEQILKETEEQADRKQKELLEKAAKEVERRREEWFDSLEKERESFTDELRRLASKQVYSLTRKVIKDLADSDLDEMISGRFTARLKELDDEKKKELALAAGEEKKIVVKSGSRLSKELRGRITRTIHDEIGSDSEVSWETDREMMPGIELNCGGREVIWSTEKYLDELESETDRRLDRQGVELSSGIGAGSLKSEKKKNKNGHGEK